MSEPEQFDVKSFIQTAARQLVESKTTDPAGALQQKIKALWDEGLEDEGFMVSTELERLGAVRAIALARLEAVPRKYKPGKFEESRDESAETRPDGPAHTWKLPNGALLGMANLADIDDAIARHRVKALAHAGWVKFYATVKAKMIAAKVHSVGELFSEPELLTLSVSNGVAASSPTPPEDTHNG